MARYRTHTVEFKRRLVEEHLGEGTSLNRLARRHDISREPLRTRPVPSPGCPSASRRSYATA